MANFNWSNMGKSLLLCIGCITIGALTDFYLHTTAGYGIAIGFLSALVFPA